jgi:hypothetical protein
MHDTRKKGAGFAHDMVASLIFPLMMPYDGAILSCPYRQGGGAALVTELGVRGQRSLALGAVGPRGDERKLEVRRIRAGLGHRRWRRKVCARWTNMKPCLSALFSTSNDLQRHFRQ